MYLGNLLDILYKRSINKESNGIKESKRILNKFDSLLKKIHIKRKNTITIDALCIKQGRI